jgi:hypothetical protein
MAQKHSAPACESQAAEMIHLETRNGLTTKHAKSAKIKDGEHLRSATQVRHFRKSNYRILTPPRKAILAIARLPVFDASKITKNSKKILTKTESSRCESKASETGSWQRRKTRTNGGVKNQ